MNNFFPVIVTYNKDFHNQVKISIITAQWNNARQHAWPTHPPQTGGPQQQTWNNPSPYWNNPLQPWGANAAQPLWNIPSARPTMIVQTAPTTEPPDSPPAKVVVVHAPQIPGQWQSGGLFPQNNAQPGMGLTQGSTMWGGMGNGPHQQWGQQPNLNPSQMQQSALWGGPGRLNQQQQQANQARRPWQNSGQLQWVHNNQRSPWQRGADTPHLGQQSTFQQSQNMLGQRNFQGPQQDHSIILQEPQQLRQPQHNQMRHENVQRFQQHVNSQHMQTMPQNRQRSQSHAAHMMRNNQVPTMQHEMQLNQVPTMQHEMQHNQVPTQHEQSFQHPEPQTHTAEQPRLPYDPHYDPHQARILHQEQHVLEPNLPPQDPGGHHQQQKQVPVDPHEPHYPEPITQHRAPIQHDPAPPYQDPNQHEPPPSSGDPNQHEPPIHYQDPNQHEPLPQYRDPNQHEPQPPYHDPNQHEPQPPYRDPNQHEPQPPYRDPNQHEPPTPYRDPNQHEPQPPYRDPNQREPQPHYPEPNVRPRTSQRVKLPEHQDPTPNNPHQQVEHATHYHEPQSAPHEVPVPSQTREQPRHVQQPRQPPERHSHHPQTVSDPHHPPERRSHLPQGEQSVHLQHPRHSLTVHDHPPVYRQPPRHEQVHHHPRPKPHRPAFRTYPNSSATLAKHSPQYSPPYRNQTIFIQSTTPAPPQYSHYIQAQLGPPETATSDPSVRVQRYLTDASHNPPVWPVNHQQGPPHTLRHEPLHTLPHQTGPSPQLHIQHVPVPNPIQPSTTTVTTTQLPLIGTTSIPAELMLMNIEPSLLAALSPQELLQLAQMVSNPTTNAGVSPQLGPPVTAANNATGLTPPTLKYGVTHADGSVTDEVYTLVASRVQRIVSMTTVPHLLLKRMTAYILFDRNRGTFALRSKIIKDICYAGFLDDDVTGSFRDVVNKTKQVDILHINGNDKVFFYKEEEQLLFSDVLREAGYYVAGSCGKDSFLFRVSRVTNPDTQIGNKVIPGAACPFGPPFRQSFYSVAKCDNGACPPSYTCNVKYDVCCPDMPSTTHCFEFSIGKICVTYMPGRRIID